MVGRYVIVCYWEYGDYPMLERITYETKYCS